MRVILREPERSDRPFGVILRCSGPQDDALARTPHSRIRKIDSPNSPVRRPFDPRDERIRASFPIDDALRKIVLRILEYNERIAHRGGGEFRRRLTDRHRVVDGLPGALEDAELLVLDQAVAADGPRHPHHRFGLRCHPLLVDDLAVASSSLPTSGDPGEFVDGAGALSGDRTGENGKNDNGSKKNTHLIEASGLDLSC